ncbi:MAG: hypothetical protein Kow00129_10340 [Thermoleophilia bacterium]
MDSAGELVRVTEVEAFDAIALTRRGPYWKLSEPLARLRDFMASRHLDPSGPPLGIFYDDPETTPSKQTRYTLAYPVEPEVAREAQESLKEDPLPPNFDGERIEVRHVPASQIAVLEFEGPGKDSAQAYAALSSWIGRQGFSVAGPPREVYLAEPGSLSGGRIHVLIQQPLVLPER